MGSYTPTPDYGRRLLPIVIDQIARDEPEKPCFSLPETDSDLSRGYADVDYATFANAINQLAWLIERELGWSDKFETMTYLGTPDIRYHFLQMACVKTGYQVLFSSHTNSLTGHLALMDKCNSSILLSASGVAVDDILTSRPMQHLLIPELDDLLSAAPVKHYAFNKTYEEAAMDPYLILHSSGTTGLPKPIRFNHASMAAMDAQRALPDIDEVSGMRRTFESTHAGPQRLLVPFFHFHAVASLAVMSSVVFSGAIYVNAFRHRALQPSDLFDVLEHANADIAFFSPSLIQDLASQPESPRYLKRLRMIIYGGAALNHKAAEYVSQYTRLRAQWGITETCKIVDLEAEPEDYDYCAFDLASNGLEFRPVSEDVHEMIIHRTPKSYPHTVIFHRDPSTPDEWHIGDLWTPHPDPAKAKNLWKFCGRTDDLISYQDGVNFHPTAYELKHSEHPLISNACIAGTGHNQPVLVLELVDPSLASTPAQKQELLEKLWTESVEPVNTVAPRNGQIARTHIVVATTEKPFEKSVKGTVARKATLKKFEVETESVYRWHGDRWMDVTERFAKN